MTSQTRDGEWAGACGGRGYTVRPSPTISHHTSQWLARRSTAASVAYRASEGPPSVRPLTTLQHSRTLRENRFSNNTEWQRQRQWAGAGRAYWYNPYCYTVRWRHDCRSVNRQEHRTRTRQHQSVSKVVGPSVVWLDSQARWGESTAACSRSRMNVVPKRGWFTAELEVRFPLPPPSYQETVNSSTKSKGRRMTR